MNIPKVRSMVSLRSGKPVANQIIITTDEGKFFQSYDSIIAFSPRSPLEALILLQPHLGLTS